MQRAPAFLTAISAAAIVLIALPVFGAQFPFLEPDFDRALAQAAKSKKKLMVSFTTSWCGPCKRLKKKVFHSPDMIALSDEMLGVVIDAESRTGKPVADRFSVTRYPTTVFLDAAGQEEARIVGYRERPGFIKLTKNWLAGTLDEQPSGKKRGGKSASLWAAGFRSAYAGKASAEGLLGRVVSSPDKDAEARAGFAELALAERVYLRSRKDPDEARKRLEALRAARPGSRAAELAAYPLAKAHLEESRPQAAQKLMGKELSKRRGAAEVYYWIGALAMDYPTLNQKQAIRLLKKGTRKHPKDDGLWGLLAQLEARAGNDTGAKRAQKRADALRPELATAR